MAKIAIPMIRDDRDSFEYRIKIDPRLNDDLLAYRACYTQAYGQEIEAKDLLEPILRRFLANDRGFRRFRKSKTKLDERSDARGMRPAAEAVG